MLPHRQRAIQTAARPGAACRGGGLTSLELLVQYRDASGTGHIALATEACLASRVSFHTQGTSTYLSSRGHVLPCPQPGATSAGLPLPVSSRSVLRWARPRDVS